LIFLTFDPLALAAHEAPRESGLHSPLLRLMRAVYRPNAEHTSHQRCTSHTPMGPFGACLAGGRQHTLVMHPRRHCRGAVFGRRETCQHFPFVKNSVLGAESFLYVGRESSGGASPDRRLCL
jgi:hypothetical protein